MKKKVCLIGLSVALLLCGCVGATNVVSTTAVSTEDFSEVNELISDRIQNAYKALLTNAVKFEDTLEIKGIKCKWLLLDDGRVGETYVVFDYISDEGDGNTRKLFACRLIAKDVKCYLDGSNKAISINAEINACLGDGYADYYPNEVPEVFGTDYVKLFAPANGLFNDRDFYYYSLSQASIAQILD